MDIAQKRVESRRVRHLRIRKRVEGTPQRPRMCVRRSLKHMSVQLVDDINGVSLLQMTTAAKSFQEAHSALTKTEQGVKLGAEIAAAAKSKGIEKVVFDRSGYLFHGRVKALADAAREAGMDF
jgi:large subunit ribosomal protein L18